MTDPTWTDADRALHDWGIANGHPVTVTTGNIRAYVDCEPCQFVQQAATTSEATRKGLAHLTRARLDQDAR